MARVAPAVTATAVVATAVAMATVVVATVGGGVAAAPPAGASASSDGGGRSATGERAAPRALGVTGTVGAGQVWDVSGDGRYVLYGSEPARRLDLWTGHVTAVATGPYTSAAVYDGALDHDGSTAALRVGGFDPATGARALDVFVAEVATATVERISETPAGASAGADSVSISDDGRRVGFVSSSPLLTAGDGDSSRDVFVHDRPSGTLSRVSLGTGGVDLDAPVLGRLSGDGEHVMLTTNAPDVVAGSPGGGTFVRRLADGLVWRADPEAPGVPGGAGSQGQSISADGQRVSFVREVPGVGGPRPQPFVYDRATDQSTPVNVTADGDLAAGGGRLTEISGDGTSIVFTSGASDLPGAPAFCDCAYVRDLDTGTTRLVSRSTTGTPGSTWGEVHISGDGDVVTFQSGTVLVPGPGPGGEVPAGYWHDVEVVVEPYAGFQAWAGRQIQDFTGRAATYGELVTLRGELEASRTTRGRLVDQLAHGRWADPRAPLARLYWAAFERVPDTAGFQHWLTQLQSRRLTLAQVATAFTRSAEFRRTYAGLGDRAFVEAVYRNVFDREPDTAGRDHWVRRLREGLTRAGLLRAFAESAEGRERLAPPTDTALVWLGMMRRLPSAAVAAAWIDDLRGGTPLARVVEVRLADTATYWDR